jgi:hypothetical protein
MPHARRFALPLAALATAAVLAAGCGGSDAGGQTAEPQPQPTARTEDFPSADGRALPEIIGGMQQGPELAPSVSVLDKGVNRIGFALFDSAGKQIPGAPVALYIGRTSGADARGPFVARSESLKVPAQFESQQTATDPDAAHSVYVADVRFPRRGTFRMLAVAKLDGRLVTTSYQDMKVGPPTPAPPAVGERAPRIHTLTPADVGGDVKKLDTRVPPAPQLLRDDFADVVGRKPIVITFATPQLCQTKVCGPVVDIVAEVHAKVGDKVSFIHQEVYADNDPNKGIRPQLTAFNLRSEPWTFVIDRDGRVSSRFEGAFSAGELERAVAKVTT